MLHRYSLVHKVAQNACRHHQPSLRALQPHVEGPCHAAATCTPGAEPDCVLRDRLASNARASTGPHSNIHPLRPGTVLSRTRGTTIIAHARLPAPLGNGITRAAGRVTRHSICADALAAARIVCGSPSRGVTTAAHTTSGVPAAASSTASYGDSGNHTSGNSNSNSGGSSNPGALVCFYSDHWQVPLPEGHRFPMLKYAATRKALQEDPSLEGIIEFRQGPLVHLQDTHLVHDAGYVERFRSGAMTETEMRNVGFPWSPILVNRTLSSCGGTLAAMRLVVEEGRRIAANIAGGTHHAFRDRGEGFCVLNDIGVAAAVALRDYGLSSVLVVDLDVHQGNGTAALFAQEQRVVTFDMHGDKNYPWRTRMKNTHDVPLPDATGDAEYLALLRDWLPRLIDTHKPQLLLFQAGVDALKGDSFGRLALSRQGLLERNNLVYSTALTHGIPLVITMGGGYSRPMDRSVEAHTDVYRTAAYRLAAWQRARAPQ